MSSPEIVSQPESIPLSRQLTGALDGVAYTIPISLGCVAILFGRWGPELMSAGVFATMLALAIIHMATAGSGRPIAYCARVFEAATLAAMLDRSVQLMPAWQLENTVGVQLALMCLTVVGASVCVGLLYLFRADRLTRFIPAPVFAGFAISVAVLLLNSQSQSLWKLLQMGEEPAVLVSVALGALATGFAVRRFRPGLPAAGLALIAGTAISLLWLAVGHHSHTVNATNTQHLIPFMTADFRALVAEHVKIWPVLGMIMLDALILGTMIFINTSMADRLMTHLDDRPSSSRGDNILRMAALAVCGLLGACPVSGSTQSSLAATRATALSGHVMLGMGLLAMAVYFSGVLGWLPLAAVAGALLYEAWYMVDRPSAKLLLRWIRRQPMMTNAREDLALVAAVTLSAVLVNMVVAVFLGLLLGLVLFAVRNARRPVRYIWSGGELRSNCARSRSDMRLLASHAQAIRIFELEGDLFFGSADSLDGSLRKGIVQTDCAILDWSRVHNLDSSVAQTIAKFERHARLNGTLILHAGADMQAGNVGPELLAHLPGARFSPDLDRALELAENHVLHLHGGLADSHAQTSMSEAISLYQSLDSHERQLLDAAMKQRFHPAGDLLMAAGDPSDELMLVLHGSASVVVRTLEGKDIRLAGVRRGATIGEIGFLDRAPRSASVIAQEDITVAVLTRPAYEVLAEKEPRLVQRLLANIALDVATRMRQTNRLAVSRQGRN